MKKIFTAEIWIPLLLGLVFFLVTAPGVDWGAPDIWHPDELVVRVHKALEGDWEFDTVNFDYPSLPKYVMYGVGKIVFGLGYSKKEFIISARLISTLLGAMSIGLTYWIVRMLGGRKSIGFLAGILLILNREFMANAHWAHNDHYVIFFALLATFALIQYCLKAKKPWLYFSFFCVGLAASSKYNGGILLLAPIIFYLVLNRQTLKKDFLRVVETIFVGVILCFFGFALGTPKAILWAAYYFKRMLPVIQYQTSYARGPDSVIGLIGQFWMFRTIFGLPLLVFVMGGILFWVVLLVRAAGQKQSIKPNQLGVIVLLVAFVLLDLPFMVSYNYQYRYFLPTVPLLIVIFVLFLQTLFDYFKGNRLRLFEGLTIAILTFVIATSSLQIASIYLLFENDARIAGTEYLATLPPGGKIEYTFYTPSINRDQFSNSRNYPLYFKKSPDQELPTSPHYEFNTGEAGIEDRKPDYLVVDDFTYDRFEDEYVCSLHQAECDFFARLLAGETHYQLIKTFQYSLPSYLPDPKIGFVNPTIQVYQRKP